MHETTPIHDDISRARHGLIRMLGNSTDDLEDQLTVIEALAVLEDVNPPYPPPGECGDPWAVAEGLPAVLAALTSAIEAAPTAAEATRAAHASRILRCRVSRPAP